MSGGKKPNWLRRTWGHEWLCNGVSVQLYRVDSGYQWKAFDANGWMAAESNQNKTYPLRVAKLLGHATGKALASLVSR